MGPDEMYVEITVAITVTSSRSLIESSVMLDMGNPENISRILTLHLVTGVEGKET